MMRVLDLRADPDNFFKKLVQARECALLLDYDGTLAPFHIERDRAFPYPGVQGVLRQISALGNTRLVIVSGRPANELPPLLEFGDHRLEFWGCHGWERLLPDGTYYRAQPPKQALKGLALAYSRVLALACSRLRRMFAIDRYVEQKPVGLALHWRGCAPQVIAKIHDSVTEEWIWIALETGLELRMFEEGMELRVPGRTKAAAVETIFEETGGEAVVAYLGGGCTRTDEDAFQALKGKGLTVLVRCEARPTTADLWVKPPHELLEFLWLWEDLRSRGGLSV